MAKENSLNRQGLFVIAFLIVQYLLGIYTNMFVSFPENAKEGQLWEFAWRQIPLALHIIVGLALMIGATSLVVKSIKSKNRNWLIASSVGSGAILVAILAGATFIPTQSDSYSFIMAVSFIIALLAFGWGVYKERG